MSKHLPQIAYRDKMKHEASQARTLRDIGSVGLVEIGIFFPKYLDGVASSSLEPPY